MAKHVNVKDLSDSSLFDADGFPIGSTENIIREQRKHGTNSWNKETKVGQALWDSAGDNYEAIERIPYSFDMPIDTSYTITSGAGPSEDIKGYLRKEIPIDANVLLNCDVPTTIEKTITDPTYDIQYTMVGVANENYLDIPAVEYTITATLVYPNPLNETYDITAVCTFSGTDIALLDYDDAGATANKSVTTRQLLYRVGDYFYPDIKKNTYIITDTESSTEPVVGEAVTDYIAPTTDWIITITYTNTIVKITEDIDNDGSYVIDSEDLDLESRVGISFIVAPFTRTDAISYEAVDSSKIIGTRTYAVFNKYAENIFGEATAEIKRDMLAIFDGYGDRLDSRVVQLNNTDNTATCTQNLVSNSSDITVTVSYGVSSTSTTTIAYDDIDDITKFALTGVGGSGGDLTYNIPSTIRTASTTNILIDDISIGDIFYIDIRDYIEDEFTIDVENDDYDISVKSVSKPGILIEYEPYRLVVRRVECPDDDIIYVRAGYYWINQNEKYLYNSAITMTNPTITSNSITLPAIVDEDILPFSFVEIISSGNKLNYDFKIDEDTGVKSLSGLTGSYYVKDNKIYLSTDISSVSSVKIQPKEDIYINTGLNVNPLVSWKRRYFVEYSEYTQILTSVYVEKFNSLINIYAYDQYENPISGASVAIGHNGLATPANANFRLIDSGLSLQTSISGLTTNDEGRATVYYEKYNSNAALNNNICKIDVTLSGTTITKRVTLNNEGEVAQNNDEEDWFLLADYSSSVRLGSTFTARVNLMDRDGNEFVSDLSNAGVVTLYYRYYGNAGYEDDTSSWILDSVTTVTKSGNLISLVPNKKAIYKVVIDSDAAGAMSPKIITFRSY